MEMEYYSAIKKNEMMSFAAICMDLESVILSQVSQTEREKYHMKSLICGLYKEMIQMNLQNRKRLTDFENELMVVEGGGRRASLGVWDGHVHTAVLKVNNQQGLTVLHRGLCSMLCGCPDGRKPGGEWIPVYVWLSPFAVHLKLPQHC